MKAIRADCEYKLSLGYEFDYEGLRVVFNDEENRMENISVFDDKFIRGGEGLKDESDK